MKATAIIENYTSFEVFDAIYDLKNRMSWDTVFRDFKKIRNETENNPEVLYMSIKVIILTFIFIFKFFINTGS